MNRKLITAAIALTAWTGSASAVVVSNATGNGLGTVLDNATVGGDLSIDVNDDQINDSFDSYWQMAGGSGTSTITMVFELAGKRASNTFGIYDRDNPDTTVQLFAGADGVADQTTLSIDTDGNVVVDGEGTGVNLASGQFGFYLSRPGIEFFSDSSLNSGVDQMAAYQGTNADTLDLAGLGEALWTDDQYIIAWEDLPYNTSDKDVNDLVVMIDGVVNVPEPGTLALLGLGLAGLGAARRWRSGS